MRAPTTKLEAIEQLGDELFAEFACDCEVCFRTSELCPATRSEIELFLRSELEDKRNEEYEETRAYDEWWMNEGTWK